MVAREDDARVPARHRSCSACVLAFLSLFSVSPQTMLELRHLPKVALLALFVVCGVDASFSMCNATVMGVYEFFGSDVDSCQGSYCSFLILWDVHRVCSVYSGNLGLKQCY